MIFARPRVSLPHLPAAILPVLTLTCMVTLAGCSGSGSQSGAGGKGKGPSGPPEVGYIVAKLSSVPIVTELAGRTTAFESSDVRPQVSGVIYRRYFTEGSLVGNVLGELGLTDAWEVEGDPVYGLGQTDVEGLTALPEDTRFWYIANDAFGDPYQDELADNAVWKGLPFVESGDVTRFPDSLWTFGGPSSMGQVVDAAVEAAEAGQ